MQNLRYYFANVLLLGLLTAARAAPAARAASGADLGVCQERTKELQTDDFSIVLQTGELDDWTNEQRPNICTVQNSDKVTCNMDFVNHTLSSDWCLDVPNTVYLETTLILKCENENNKKHVFYSVRNRPACYSTSCYDGYDMSILETLERATFDHLFAEFKNPNSDSEWGNNAFDNCIEMRLDFTEPIISEAVAVVLTANPTISPAPTSSAAPTDSPTISPAPSISPAPTATPKELTCKDESASLVAGYSTMRTLGAEIAPTLSGVALGLNAIQDLMSIDTLTGEGFQDHCNLVDGKDVSALCEFDYNDAIATTSGTENSVAELCQEASGVYVEDSVAITCTSVEDFSQKTRLVFQNKPSCRSRLCNADDIREVATVEFDRWMKLTLEEGLAEASVANGGSILSDPQVCVIDTEDEDQDEEEGVVVAVGGIILSNINGDPIQPTDECQVFTNAVDGDINMYNEKAVFQKDILQYINTDLRQICGSPKPGELECNFDWSEIFEPDSEDSSEIQKADAAAFKDLCMPDGTGNSGAGQYVESTFRVICSNIEEDLLTVTNTNVPGCVGRPCTPGQAEFLFDDDYTYMADQFIKKGWDCTTEVLSVYAPHYNPFFGTYSMADISINEQFDPEVETVPDEEEGQDLSGPLWDEVNDGSSGPALSEGLEFRNTPPPTDESNLHLRGPQYGNLFKTDPPRVVTPQAPLEESSSPSRFSTVLLLIPAALSMLIL